MNAWGYGLANYDGDSFPSRIENKGGTVFKGEFTTNFSWFRDEDHCLWVQ